MSDTPPVFCQGRHIRLRPAWIEDAGTIARLRNASRHCFLNDNEITTDQAIQWLKAMNFPEEALLRIETHAGERLGFAGWSHLDMNRREAEIGRLMIDPRAILRHIDQPRRQDIAVDAVRAIGHTLFTQSGLQRIRTTYIEGNRNAARVNQRCGMQITASETHTRKDGKTLEIIQLTLEFQDWQALQPIWAQEETRP